MGLLMRRHRPDHYPGYGRPVPVQETAATQPEQAVPVQTEEPAITKKKKKE